MGNKGPAIDRFAIYSYIHSPDSPTVHIIHTAVMHTFPCVFLLISSVEPSGPPAELMILASGPSTLTVSWSAPLLYPEVVLGYIVRCAPKSDNSNIMELSRGNERFNAQFHSLIPNTTYNCEVHTTSNFGNSTPATDTASTLPRESKFVDVSVSRINGRDESFH